MSRVRTAKGRALLPGEGPVRDALGRVGLAVARRYRLRLAGTTFVGVTGSGGKTTTKELIAAVLGTALAGTKSPGSENSITALGKTILRTRARHGFCVLEIAALEPGSVAERSRLVRPSIAVVTGIGSDHHKVFRTLEATAAEKHALVEAVPPHGTLVLNADDPRVIAMADGFAGRVISVGRSPGATLRAEDVRSAWPETLTFTVRHDDVVAPVRTRLNGKHWTTAVLAALGVGVALGVPLEGALAAVGAFEPVRGRMSTLRQGGVTFIRDDTKAPLWSLDTVFDFLEDARARRKILIVGTISDYSAARSPTYAGVARRALEVADEVVFVGPNVPHARRLPESVAAFPTVREAAAHFRTALRDGDLVVLKGSQRADHLLRIALARTTQVRCWRKSCGRIIHCDECRLLRVPGG